MTGAERRGEKGGVEREREERGERRREREIRGEKMKGGNKNIKRIKKRRGRGRKSE